MRDLIPEVLRAVLSLAALCCLIPRTTLADPQKYKIGVIAPLSGDFAKYGELVRKGVERVKRSDIEWVFEDELCEPSKAVAAYQKLSSVNGVSFFIGPCCGSPQKAVAPLLKHKQQIVLLPSSAPASVYAASGGKMYSAQYSIDAESTFIAEEMNKRALKKVAIVYVDNDFSEAHEAAFRKTFKGEVVYALHAPAFDAAYMKDAALALENLAFDSIYVPDASSLLLGLLKELHKIGVEKRPVYSVYSAQMPDILKAEGEQAEGLLYSYPDLAGNADAVEYFPNVAATILADYVEQCHGTYDCVAEKFKAERNFQADGSLAGKIILKTVKDGKFVPRTPLPLRLKRPHRGWVFAASKKLIGNPNLPLSCTRFSRDLALQARRC